MNAIVHVTQSSVVRLAGALISVGMVLCGSQARAEGIVQPATSDAGVGSGYSEADLAGFEQAAAAQATAARVAVLRGTVGMAKTRTSTAKSAPATSGSDQDLFPLSGQISPLLVARPVTATQTSNAPSIKRSAGALPVGVPLSDLRPLPSHR